MTKYRVNLANQGKRLPVCCLAPLIEWFLPKADFEMEVSMPEATRESPPVEEKDRKKAGLAWGRSWTVMQSQHRPRGSSKAGMILQTYPEWGWGCWAFKHLNPRVIRLRCSRKGGMIWRVISVFILRQLITVSTIAPLGKNVATWVRAMFTSHWLSRHSIQWHEYWQSQ